MTWFTNLKISAKLLLSYVLLCILMLLVGAMGIRGLDIMRDNVNALYYDSMSGISNIIESRTNIEGARLYMQRIVLPQNRAQISALEAEIQKRVDANTAALKIYENSMTAPEDKVMFQELQKLLVIYRDVRTKTIDLVKSGDYDAAAEQYYNQLVPATANLVNYTTKMSDWNDEVGKSYIKNAEESYQSAMTTMITIIIVGIVLAMVLGYFIARSIANPLNVIVGISNDVAAGNLTRKIEANRRDEIGMLQTSIKDMITNLRDIVTNVQSSADNVAASSEELTASADQSAQASNSVASSIMDVAQGAEKQLVIVSETVGTAEKMSAEAEQIAANASIVATTSEKTAQSADSGLKAVETAISQMSSIQKTVETLAEEITGLGMRSKEIGQIVETISGIAGQTNLLALNAAIEAARAGEQGRGFAVVAEEVRKLAEQSQEAAKQISSLIGGIQNDTDKAVQAMEAGTREVKVGSDLVNSAGVAFKEISGLIDQTSAQVKEISEAIGHMASDSQIVVAGAQEIDSVSRETSSQTQSVSAATEEQLASMQEIASASQALAKRAEELQIITQRFVM